MHESMKKTNLFIAPHSDDEALFGSYIILRNKPIKVVVCTDGIQHEEKFDIKTETRRNESLSACKILGCDVEFLGLSDKKLEREQLKKRLSALDGNLIFVPLKTGGNPHHDMVSEVAEEIWPLKKLCFYGTYSDKNLRPVGEQGFLPSKEEAITKIKALGCYQSQIKINPHHFEAVAGRVPEYITLK